MGDGVGDGVGWGMLTFHGELSKPCPTWPHPRHVGGIRSSTLSMLLYIRANSQESVQHGIL